MFFILYVYESSGVAFFGENLRIKTHATVHAQKPTMDKKLLIKIISKVIGLTRALGVDAYRASYSSNFSLTETVKLQKTYFL